MLGGKVKFAILLSVATALSLQTAQAYIVRCPEGKDIHHNGSEYYASSGITDALGPEEPLEDYSVDFKGQAPGKNWFTGSFGRPVLEKDTGQPASCTYWDPTGKQLKLSTQDDFIAHECDLAMSGHYFHCIASEWQKKGSLKSKKESLKK